jgi:hypothetical protein
MEYTAKNKQREKNIKKGENISTSCLFIAPCAPVTFDLLYQEHLSLDLLYQVHCSLFD